MSASNNNTPLEKEPPSRGDNWTEWATKAQQGDKAAYRNLLNDISDFSRTYLLKGLANPDWAEDITQEVLISIHKALPTYSPERSFRPWVMAIINFRRTDFLRKHYGERGDKKTTLENQDFQRAHVTNPAHTGEYKDIEAALQSLPEKQRKVFQMMKIEGYSAKEVAKEMKMSVSAVKVSAHRTTKKLKEQLG